MAFGPARCPSTGKHQLRRCADCSACPVGRRLESARGDRSASVPAGSGHHHRATRASPPSEYDQELERHQACCPPWGGGAARGATRACCPRSREWSRAWKAARSAPGALPKGVRTALRPALRSASRSAAEEPACWEPLGVKSGQRAAEPRAAARHRASTDVRSAAPLAFAGSRISELVPRATTSAAMPGG